MRKAILSVLFIVPCLLPAQSYELQVLQDQLYQDISNPDYAIKDTSAYFGNVNTRPDMYFKAFGKDYDLYDRVYIPIKEGYAYFMNATRSSTLYASKGIFAARPGSNQESEFSFRHDTAMGESRFVLQWKNMGFDGGDSSDFINFQLWMYGSSGIIEMRIGPNSVKPGLWENGADGPIIGLLEMDDGFNTIYEELWLTGDPASPSVNTTETFSQLDSTPEAGMVYRFAPPGSGIDKIHNKNSIVVYPTLIREEKALFVRKQPEDMFSYSLYDTGGRLITGGSRTGNAIEIPELSAGMYCLIISCNGISSAQKITRQ